MSTPRDRALEAAIDLLGTQGLRSLTHARVDERAGIPKGSTSNYFRTRAALLEGVGGWVADHERGDFQPGFDPAIATADDLIDAFCELIEAETGPFRTRTLARYVLFLEGTHNEALRAASIRDRKRLEQWIQGILTAMGAPSPVPATKALMACGDGLVLHRVTVDPDAELRPALAIVVNACLRGEG